MKNKFIIFLYIFLNMGCNCQAINLLEKELENSYNSRSSYLPPTHTELKAAEKLFESLLKNKKIIKEEVMKWENLGFSLKSIKEGEQEFAVISELSSIEKRGYGFYIIKLNFNGSENILQAPHRPSDLYTHQIIFKLFIEDNYLATAFNTTSRKIVDLAKEEQSFYNAFTIAAANVLKNPRLIQLHAFDASEHAIKGDLILSISKKKFSAFADKIAGCLKDNLKAYSHFIILQYPKDTNDLGGIKNINAKKFYETKPYGSFFHVETSKTLREELNNNINVRKAFSKCFTGT